MEDSHYPSPNEVSTVVDKTGQRYKGLEDIGKGLKLVKRYELVEPVANPKKDILSKFFKFNENKPNNHNN